MDRVWRVLGLGGGHVQIGKFGSRSTKISGGSLPTRRPSTMPELDDDVKAYLKKYTTEAAPSEHFPLMELPAYDLEEKVRAPAQLLFLSARALSHHTHSPVSPPSHTNRSPPPRSSTSQRRATTTTTPSSSARRLWAMKPPTLKQIYLSKNNVGDAGAIGLAAGLKELEAMDTIHFADNQIGDAGMAALAPALAPLGCTTIVFTRNTFGDEGAAAFAKALADPESFKNLEWLFLNECQISDKGAAALAAALLTGCKELVRFNIADNKIGDAGASAIADAFNKGAIAQTGEFFYFQGNPVTDEGKNAIAKACRGKIRVHLGWPPPLGALEPEDWDR